MSDLNNQVNTPDRAPQPLGCRRFPGAPLRCMKTPLVNSARGIISVWQVPDTFRSIYSHAAEVRTPRRVLFISGQFGVAPDDHVREDFAAQCEQAMCDTLLRRGRRNLGISGYVGAIIEPWHLVRPPDRKTGPLAGIIIERRDPQDDVRLDGTLGDEMRSTYRAEVATFARRRLERGQLVLPGQPSKMNPINGSR